MANETFEVYTLTSKLNLDTSQFDRAYGTSRQKMTTLAGDVGKLTKTTDAHRASQGRLNAIFGDFQARLTGLGGPLAGTAQHYTNLLGLTGSLTASTGRFNIALGASLAVGIGVAGAMFTLAKRAAEAGDEIFDLTQKVNFSAESVSALKNSGETAGVEFTALSAGLGIFNKNLESVNEGNKKLSGTFRALKIDVSDNEAALRSAFRALNDVEDGGQQTALAMALFGKSGKEVLGIIKAMNGDLDAAIARYRQLGTLITTESAEAANEFSDTLKELEHQFDAVTRAIGERFMPTVLSAMKDIGAALQSNRGDFSNWATDVVSIVSFMAEQVKHILEGLAIVMEGYRKTFGEGSLFGDLSKNVSGDPTILLTQDPFVIASKIQAVDKARAAITNPQRADDNGEFAIAGGAGQYSVGSGVGQPRKRGGRINIPGGGGGGKGSDPAKEAGRIARLQLEATLAGLEAEQSANARSLAIRRRDFNDYATQYMVIENRRHQAVVAGLDLERQAAEKLRTGKDVALLEISNKRAEENTEHEKNRNKILDERGDILDQIDKFLRDQERDINALTVSTTGWDTAYQRFVDTLQEEGVTIEENTRLRIEGNIARAKELELVLSVTRARQVANSVRDRIVTREMRERPPWIDLGGGSTVGGEPATTGRPRIATVDEQVRRERAEIFRDHMQDIASDLTHLIDDSLTEGFRRGVKAGVIEFGLGILDMVRSEALNELERRIAKVLIGGGETQGTQSGGGWVSKIFGVLISGIAGGGIGLGGSSGGLGSTIGGAIGGHAAGGFMWPGEWSWVGEKGPELVKAGSRGASVMSNAESSRHATGRGMVVNQYIQVASMYEAGNRRTQTQAMRGLQQAAQRGYSLRG